MASVASQVLTFMPAEDLSAGSEPEGDELAVVGVAAEDDLVVAAGLDVAGVFHAQVVLVGEEVRYPVVGDVLAEHRFGRGLRLVQPATV